jgi:hypothetical protein
MTACARRTNICGEGWHGVWICCCAALVFAARCGVPAEDDDPDAEPSAGWYGGSLRSLRPDPPAAAA